MYRRKLHSSSEMRYLVNRTAIHVVLYYHKITEYEIKCCMHAHHGAPRAPPSRGELYRHKTLFLDDFPIFFYYPNGTWTHPPTSKLFLDFWNFFNFAKSLIQLSELTRHEQNKNAHASKWQQRGFIRTQAPSIGSLSFYH